MLRHEEPVAIVINELTGGKMKGLPSVSGGSKKVWAGALATLIFGLSNATYAAGGTGSGTAGSGAGGEGSGRTMGGAPKGNEPSLGSQRAEDPTTRSGSASKASGSAGKASGASTGEKGFSNLRGDKGGKGAGNTTTTEATPAKD
jgi:hypothetical protein